MARIAVVSVNTAKGEDSGHIVHLSDASESHHELSFPRIHRKYGSHDMRTRRRHGHAAAPAYYPNSVHVRPHGSFTKASLPLRTPPGPSAGLLVWGSPPSRGRPPGRPGCSKGSGLGRRVWAPPPGRHRSRPTASRRRGLSSRAQKAGSSGQAGRPLGRWVAAGPPRAQGQL